MTVGEFVGEERARDRERRHCCLKEEEERVRKVYSRSELRGL